MKKRYLSIFLVGALAAIPMLAGAAEEKPAAKGTEGKMEVAGSADAKTRAAIEGRMNEFVAAWNKHDPKAMAAVWLAKCDLINPFGMKASGRAEIEKLFAGEHGGVMKASTYTINSGTVRMIGRGVALGEWDSVITGMTSPDGQALPPFPHHVTMVFVHEGGQWRADAVRAFQFLPPPAK